MLWNTLFGLLILGTYRYGDYITNECPQVEYACPKTCAIDHYHLPIEECKNGKKEQKSRSNKTVIPSGRQRYKKAMAENKSEGT